MGTGCVMLLVQPWRFFSLLGWYAVVLPALWWQGNR